MSCSINGWLKNKEGWVQGIICFGKTTSFACLLGSALKNIFQLKAQSRIFTKSLFRLEVENIIYNQEKEVSSELNISNKT